jgi:hypothetical protein
VTELDEAFAWLFASRSKHADTIRYELQRLQRCERELSELGWAQDLLGQVRRIADKAAADSDPYY